MRRLALLRLAFSRRLDESLAALIRDAVRAAQVEQCASLGLPGPPVECSATCDAVEIEPVEDAAGNKWRNYRAGDPKFTVTCSVNGERFEAIAQQVVSKNLASLADSISKQRA